MENGKSPIVFTKQEPVCKRKMLIVIINFLCAHYEIITKELCSILTLNSTEMQTGTKIVHWYRYAEENRFCDYVVHINHNK